MTVGPIQGVVDAIGESNQEIGGQYRTRTSAAVPEGDTILPVESCLDWPTTGSVLVQGVVYAYSSRTDTTLEGLTYVDGDSTVNGVDQALPIETLVTDVSQNRTSMDFLRGAMLVGRAIGSDLDVVGRNISVNRTPLVPSDDTFREVIKAVAYNPRGTIYGLELFLDAAVGAGNYEIIEDLIEDPNIVKVILTGTASKITEKEGKGFLSQQEFQLASGATTVPISEALATDGVVHYVRLRDENHTSDFRNQLPTADTLVEYEGDAGTQLWTYSGTEGVSVSQVAGRYIQIDLQAIGAKYYYHDARITPKMNAGINMLYNLVDTEGFGSSTGQWGAYIADSVKICGWGVLHGLGESNNVYQIGLTSGGTFIASYAAILDPNTWYDVELKKFGEDRVELWIDNELVQTAAYSSFSPATAYRIAFASYISGSWEGPIGRIKQTGYYVFPTVDHWAAQGEAGAVLAASPQNLDVGAGDAIFVSGDVGKRVIISGGAVSQTPATGSNNGTFEIQTFNSAQNVTLKGEDRIDAFVETGKPNQFNAEGRVFQYPDDIGKTIVISGSASNDGSRTIIGLLDPDDSTDYSSPGVAPDLDAFDTRTPTKTDKAIVSGGSAYVSETALSWRLDPVFTDETPLDWIMADAGSVAGTTLTLRQALPNGAQVVEVDITTVLSGQLLENVTINNTLVTAGPPRDYTHWPLYLSDSLGFVRYYLDLLTAAGVIPELLLEE